MSTCWIGANLTSRRASRTRRASRRGRGSRGGRAGGPTLRCASRGSSRSRGRGPARDRVRAGRGRAAGQGGLFGMAPMIQFRQTADQSRQRRSLCWAWLRKRSACQAASSVTPAAAARSQASAISWGVGKPPGSGTSGFRRPEARSAFAGSGGGPDGSTGGSLKVRVNPVRFDLSSDSPWLAPDSPCPPWPGRIPFTLGPGPGAAGSP